MTSKTTQRGRIIDFGGHQGELEPLLAVGGTIGSPLPAGQAAGITPYVTPRSLSQRR